MEVDSSYAGFVSARWSMLYRLAVLLTGTEPADDLTQAALLRAYRSWPELRDLASAEAFVKEALAQAAVAAGATSPDPEASAGSTAVRDDPGSRLAALPVRPRAVVVLRCFELLSDSEVARILRCRIDEVGTDLATALASLGVSVDGLGHQLAAVAGEVDVPLPPVGGLVAQGQQESRSRRRRTLGRSLVVAVVVVLGLAAASLVQVYSGGPDATDATPPAAGVPRSLSMLRTGPPTDVAYSVGRALHFDHAQVFFPSRPSDVAQAGSWVYVAFPSGKIVRVQSATLRGQTVTRVSQGQLVTDQAGRYVAWLAAGEPARVVLQAVEPRTTGPSYNEKLFPATPQCCDDPFVIDGLTPSADVIASLPAENRAWVWNAGMNYFAGRNLHEISALGTGVVRQVTAGEVVVQFGSTFAVGMLEDHAFVVSEELRARDADFGDPLGRRVLYVDRDGRTHVRERMSRGDRRTPRAVRLRLPALEEGWTSARWEDAHVLLDVSDDSAPDGVLVRCDVDSGDCEIAVRFAGPHVVAR